MGTEDRRVEAGRRAQPDVLAGFTSPVRRWFCETFARPSPAQEQAWPVIRRGESTLLLAPTGSGKTLAAFLCAIDDLVRRAESEGLPDAVHVLYITPLKALGNDIHRNLVVPLQGISERAGPDAPDIRIAVRSGDTPQSERARMARRPPQILITTPESLFLLLQSKSFSPALQHVHTVIIDEVHALCADKRGVHLSVSLERLEERLASPPQRIGCSATLRPLDQIAAFLVGFDNDGRQRQCTVVDAGMRKDLDVQAVAPLPDFVEAGNTALWASAYDLLLKEIAAHETTLVFCNSRYKAERTVLRLQELDERAGRIGVHHGSMSRERRLKAEDELKSGHLDALVATTSLELGIDIGSVDLVYQLESPKSVATGLQRIGRAGHLLNATSKGRVLVFERDELLEAGAICRAMLEGAIDPIRIPSNCVDVLAQQIVGAVVEQPRLRDELFRLLRRAYPYRNLQDEDFDRVLGMLAGERPFEMPMAPRALLLWDRAANRVTPGRGAKQVSAMNVGTIGETSEYDVVIDGTKKRVGKVQSEFADDQLRMGEIFVLGSTAWRVTGVQRNRIMVKEAPGSTPTVPWWTGPVEPRTAQAGERVGRLRSEVAQRLEDPGLLDWLQRSHLLCPNAAQVVVDYVREQVAAVGLVPDHANLLVETWRDELARVNVIIHSPFGERLNRTWSVAMSIAAAEGLGQRWTSTASNDLSLLTFAPPNTPPVHKPDARALLALVSSKTLPGLARRSATAAVGAGTAFRDAATCALQIQRFRQGKRVPVWLQNHRTHELFEAATGHMEYPLFDEVTRAYLEETLDVPGLSRILERIERGDIRLHYRDVEAPSPFAHGLLVRSVLSGGYEMGRDRRAHLLHLHRQVLQEVLSEEQLAHLLDQRAIDRVERRLLFRSERARARTPDELAQALRELGDIPATIDAVAAITEGDAAKLLGPLLAQDRTVAIAVPDCDDAPLRLVSTELWREYHDAFSSSKRRERLIVLKPVLEKGALTEFRPVPAADVVPERLRAPVGRDVARRALVERFVKRRGPVTAYEVANRTGWPLAEVQQVLGRLVQEGSAAQGIYTVEKAQPQVVNKTNLEEIHRLTMRYLKRELAACAPYEVVDFMTRWQHVHPDTRLEGLDGLRQAIRQIQGCEIITGALESEVLADRVRDYDSSMLDRLIASGEVRWQRFGADRVVRGKVSLCLRRDAQWLSRGAPLQLDTAASADADIAPEILRVREFFRERGSAFFDDVIEETGVDEHPAIRAVWYLAWAGELTCDTYACLRESNFQVTLSACYDLDSTPRKIVNGRMSADRVIKQMQRRSLDPRLGRWTATERLVASGTEMERGDIVRRWAEQLLRRWGIVTKDMLTAEVAAPPWSELVPELKRLELVGQVSRGYFIESHHGEQYGLPEAVELLRDCRARRSDGGELGYLDDEPMFCLTNREPANLYASSLDVIDERGQVFQRHARRGGLKHRVVLQAGQALLYQTQQMVALERTQLERCLAALRSKCTSPGMEMRVGRWNGYPIAASPVSLLLHRAGFRVDTRGEWVYPPARNAGDVPEVKPRKSYPPYFSDADPVEYGPDWTIGQAPESLRPALRRLLDAVLPRLGASGWSVLWEASGLTARYRNSARLHLRIARSFLQVCFGTRTFREDGRMQRLAPWQRHPHMRVVKEQDVGTEFAEAFTALEARARTLTDRYLELRGH